MKQLCFEYSEDPIAIRLYQTGFDEFTVQYGKQIRAGLSYFAASKELGACLMHYAACDGKLDSRDASEAHDAGDHEPYAANWPEK